MVALIVALLLGVSSFAYANDMVITSSVRAVTLSGAQDWSSAAVTCWDYEDSLAAASQASCGAACDLSGSAVYVTGKVGAKGLQVAAGTVISCSSCVTSTSDIRLSSNDNFEWTGWWRRDANDGSPRTIFETSGSNGYDFVGLQSNSGRIRYRTDKNGTSPTSANGSFPNGTWKFAAIEQETSAAKIYVCETGATDCPQSGSASSGDSYTTPSGSSFSFGASSSAQSFSADDVCLWPDPLTAQARCRLCACGFRGDVSLGGECECSGETYLNKGNDTECGTCLDHTVIACNAVGPY